MPHDVLEAVAVLKSAAEEGPVILGTLTDEELILVDKNRDVENSFDCPVLFHLTPEGRDLSVSTCLRMLMSRGELEVGEDGSTPRFVGKSAIISQLYDSVDRITTAVRTDRSDDLRQVAFRKSQSLHFVEQVDLGGAHEIIAVSEAEERELLVSLVITDEGREASAFDRKVISGTVEDQSIQDLVIRASAEAAYEVVITTAVLSDARGDGDAQFGSITVFSMPEGMLVLVNAGEGRIEMRWCDGTELRRALSRMLE